MGGDTKVKKNKISVCTQVKQDRIFVCLSCYRAVVRLAHGDSAWIHESKCDCCGRLFILDMKEKGSMESVECGQRSKLR